NGGRTLGEKRKVLLRNLHHLRVDLIKTYRVCRPAIGRYGARSKPHHANPQRWLVLQRLKGVSDATAASIIGQGGHGPGVIAILRAMQNRTVFERAETRVRLRL